MTRPTLPSQTQSRMAAFNTHGSPPDRYESLRQKRDQKLAENNLPAIEHNSVVASEIPNDSAVTYAETIFENILFLSPAEFDQKIKEQVEFWSVEKAEHEAEMRLLLEDSDQIYLDNYMMEWDFKQRTDICFKMECNKTYYQYDHEKECFVVPVQLVSRITGDREIMCFNCALGDIQDYRWLQEATNPPFADGIDQIFLMRDEHGNRMGMQYELALLRINQNLKHVWNVAGQNVIERANSMAKLLEQTDGIVDEDCHKSYLSTQVSIVHAANFLENYDSLARPMLLMSAPWFWNALDILFVMGHKSAVYIDDSHDFNVNRIMEIVMKQWADETEKLWDGPMRILRSNMPQSDVALLQRLQKAMTNDPPVKLTGLQADLREHWNQYLDAKMSKYWRQHPMHASPSEYVVHPDMLPSNIALRLLEVMPGCLHKLFNKPAQENAYFGEPSHVSSTIDPCNVLTDRYFAFLFKALCLLVDTKSVGGPRVTAPNNAMKSGRVASKYYVKK